MEVFFYILENFFIKRTKKQENFEFSAKKIEKTIDFLKNMYYNMVVEKSGEMCIIYTILCRTTP